MGSFQDQLKQFSKKLENAVSTPTSTEEALTPEFMAEHTKYSTLEAFLAAGNVHSAEDLAAVSDADWDRHVRASSTFRSWQDMKARATETLLQRRMK
jgi:hypothetical protein